MQQVKSLLIERHMDHLDKTLAYDENKNPARELFDFWNFLNAVYSREETVVTRRAMGRPVTHLKIAYAVCSTGV